MDELGHLQCSDTFVVVMLTVHFKTKNTLTLSHQTAVCINDTHTATSRKWRLRAFATHWCICIMSNMSRQQGYQATYFCLQLHDNKLYTHPLFIHDSECGGTRSFSKQGASPVCIMKWLSGGLRAYTSTLLPHPLHWSTSHPGRTPWWPLTRPSPGWEGTRCRSVWYSEGLSS